MPDCRDQGRQERTPEGLDSGSACISHHRSDRQPAILAAAEDTCSKEDTCSTEDTCSKKALRRAGIVPCHSGNVDEVMR